MWLVVEVGMSSMPVGQNFDCVVVQDGDDSLD